MHLRLLLFGILGASWVGVSISLNATESARTVQAGWTSSAPVVDGDCRDQAWQAATSFNVFDRLADITIEILTLYDADQIYLCVRFPDDDEDRLHKPYIWDAAAMRYRTGPAREDTLVLKWAIESSTKDLTLQAEKSYRADVWYWKANRTDLAGFADDKLQIYTSGNMPQATQLWSHSGQAFYLRRSGDEGTAAYLTQAFSEFMGKTVPKYTSQEPAGSRADVHAKGQWKNGYWTVEFARRLQTGHRDDVQFKTENTYLFGVSRYEIAGREPNENIAQPNFGAGEIGEHLRLGFHSQVKP